MLRHTSIPILAMLALALAGCTSGGEIQTSTGSSGDNLLSTQQITVTDSTCGVTTVIDADSASTPTISPESSITVQFEQESCPETIALDCANVTDADDPVDVNSMMRVGTAAVVGDACQMTFSVAEGSELPGGSYSCDITAGEESMSFGFNVPYYGFFEQAGDFFAAVLPVEDAIVLGGAHYASSVTESMLFSLGRAALYIMPASAVQESSYEVTPIVLTDESGNQFYGSVMSIDQIGSSYFAVGTGVANDDGEQYPFVSKFSVSEGAISIEETTFLRIRNYYDRALASDNVESEYLHAAVSNDGVIPTVSRASVTEVSGVEKLIVTLIADGGSETAFQLLLQVDPEMLSVQRAWTPLTSDTIAQIAALIDAAETETGFDDIVLHRIDCSAISSNMLGCKIELQRDPIAPEWNADIGFLLYDYLPTGEAVTVFFAEDTNIIAVADGAIGIRDNSGDAATSGIALYDAGTTDDQIIPVTGPVELGQNILLIDADAEGECRAFAGVLSELNGEQVAAPALFVLMGDGLEIAAWRAFFEWDLITQASATEVLTGGFFGTAIEAKSFYSVGGQGRGVIEAEELVGFSDHVGRLAVTDEHGNY